MSLAAARLTFQLHRFAILGIGLVVGVATLLALWYAIRLDGIPNAAACASGSGEFCGSYRELRETGSQLLFGIGLIPLVAGLFLGVPIVAQELDRSTTPLAWSLEPSRWRWFGQRVVPIIAFVVVAGLVVGAAADQLEARLQPLVDPGASFADFGMRGPLVAGRVVLVLGTGVLIGSLIGRTLPAMLLALVVGAGLVLAVDTIHQGIQAQEAIPVAADSIVEGFAGRHVDFRYELASGQLLSYEELAALHPDPQELDREVQAARQIVFIVPAERYGEVSTREAGAAAAIGMLMALATVPILTRRRPGPGRVGFGLKGLGLSRAGPRQASARDEPGIGGAIRLTLWPHRLELLAGVLVGLVVSLGCILVVARLGSLSFDQACFDQARMIGMTLECAGTTAFLNEASSAYRLFAVTAVLPWFVGALIGVVIVGREIEHGSAILAWTLSPNRRRWLLQRIAVAAALVIALLAVPSVLATELQRIAKPWVPPPELTFDNYALRGPLIVVRGLAAFGIALLAGAILGRILPGLLVAMVGCLALGMLITQLAPFGVPVDMDSDLERRHSPEEVREVEFREGLVLGGITITLLGTTAIVVSRRKPY